MSTFLEALRESQASLAELAAQEEAEAAAARQRAAEASQQLQAQSRADSGSLPQAPAYGGGGVADDLDETPPPRLPRQPASGQAPASIEARVGGVAGDHEAFRRPTEEPGRRSAGPTESGQPLTARRQTPEAQPPMPPAPVAPPPPVQAPPLPPLPPAAEDRHPFWTFYHWLIPPHVEGNLSAGRRFARWLPLLVSALVLALVAGAVVGIATQTQPGVTASATGSANPALVTPDDLIDVNTAVLMAPSQAWREGETFTTIDDLTPSPLCLAASTDLPLAGITQVRTMATGSNVAAVHRIDAYDTPETAARAFALRSTQLGRCSNVPAYLVSGALITGLGEQAVGVVTVVQDELAVYHTQIAFRTGAVVDVLDVSQTGAPLPISDALRGASALAAIACSHTGGACSQSAATAEAILPNGGTEGWLSESDIPRITPGAGRWTTTNPMTTLKLLGSGCENLNLNTVAGPTKRQQRTYLLTEDSRAPLQFGIDEVIYDFATPDAAAAMAKTIADNIGNCTSRLPTAKVKNVVAIKGTGANQAEITGSSRTVTLATSATASVSFRVAVTVSGNHLIYLLATPVAGFDFTDDQWSVLALRAALRQTQTT